MKYSSDLQTEVVCNGLKTRNTGTVFVEHSASKIAKVNRTIISDYVYFDFDHFELYCLLFTFDLDIKGHVFILNCYKQALQYSVLHLSSREE